MDTKERVTFGSKIGVILATVGCAVGLGSIWRFPYMVGANGGGTFLLAFIVFTVVLGLPIMITEFFIGRHSQKNAAGAFKTLAPGTRWSLIGYNGVLCAFLILGFYMVVSGWTLEYIWQAVSGGLSGKDTGAFAADFRAFSTGAFRPILWTFVFIAMTHIIIVAGVEKGIERASKIMMPALFLILTILCVRSLTLPAVGEGLAFFFGFDWDKLDSSVILSAMGQTFFSLSIGMGCLITYGSYFGKTTNLQKTAVEVTVINTFVALLAGIMVFPAVFSFGIEPTAGPELVFITLPNIFEQLPFGTLWSFIFYILLALAALTSTISLHEVVTAYVHEECHMSRKKAACLVSLGVVVIASLCSLSFGALKEFTIGGLILFDALDFLTAKIMMPLGGMMICIFVGLRIEKKILREELTNKGSIAFHFFNTYAFFIKYIAPVGIALIFLHELGLIEKVAVLF